MSGRHKDELEKDRREGRCEKKSHCDQNFKFVEQILQGESNQIKEQSAREFTNSLV